MDLWSVCEHSQGEGEGLTYPVGEYVRNDVRAITRDTRGDGITEFDCDFVRYRKHTSFPIRVQEEDREHPFSAVR